MNTYNYNHIKTLKEAKKIIAEQDMIIGSQFRELASLKDTQRRLKDCNSKRKREAGYGQWVSFDVVWDETLKKAQAQALHIDGVVQAKLEKVRELVRLKFDDWVFGLETQAGEKLKVVDSTDFNDIITEINKQLKKKTLKNR